MLFSTRNSTNLKNKQLEKRKKTYQPKEPKIKKGWLKRYANMVQGADIGAILK